MHKSTAQGQVTSFLKTMGMTSLTARRNGVLDLASYVDNAFGGDAEDLATVLREGSGMLQLLRLLYDADPILQKGSLMIIANLVSDAFDTKSAATKQLVMQAEVLPRIIHLVYVEDDATQAYACACLENLFQKLEFSRLASDFELVEELQRLMDESDSVNVKRHAAAALYNAVQTTHQAARKSDMANRMEKGAGGRRSFFKQREVEIELDEEKMEEVLSRQVEFVTEQVQKEAAVLTMQRLGRGRISRNVSRAVRVLSGTAMFITLFWRNGARRRRVRAAKKLQLFARSLALAREAGASPRIAFSATVVMCDHHQHVFCKHVLEKVEAIERAAE